MRHWIRLALAFALGLFGMCTAWCADSDLSLRKIGDSTLTYLGSEEFRGERSAFGLAEQDVLKLLVVAGSSREHAEPGTRTVTTPFVLDAAYGPWELQVNGDGYSHSSSAKGTKDGLTDIVTLISFKLPLSKKLALAPVLEVTLPTHGNAGSAAASQDVQLPATYEFNPRWIGLATGMVNRDDDAKSGVSRFTTSLIVELQYHIGGKEDTYFLARIKRQYQDGVGGKTKIQTEYDFPFGLTWKGAALMSQVLTPGKRSTLLGASVEFDF